MTTFISYLMVGFGIYMIIGGVVLVTLGYSISNKLNLL